jgi:chloramphenicol-sensitive protein RarD
MSSTSSSQTRNGVIAAAGAFFIWGTFPLYMKPLTYVPAMQIAAWRYLMGCIFVFTWVSLRGELAQVGRAFATPRLRWRLMLTASLLAMNWTLYAWGISNGQVLNTSLGYFINPLVNILLGVLILSERLNPLQWLAVALAACGVLALTFHASQFPWIALVLAVSFSSYGLLRKTTDVAPLPGLTVETLLVGPFALVYMSWQQMQHGNVLDHSFWPMVLLVLSGVITVVPLALFNHGTRLINYATVGMLQYIGPTLQFLTGVFIYKEPLSAERLLCYALIWLALIIYAGDSWWRMRSLRASSAA